MKSHPVKELIQHMAETIWVAWPLEATSMKEDIWDFNELHSFF